MVIDLAQRREFFVCSEEVFGGVDVERADHAQWQCISLGQLVRNLHAKPPSIDHACIESSGQPNGRHVVEKSGCCRSKRAFTDHAKRFLNRFNSGALDKPSRRIS